MTQKIACVWVPDLPIQLEQQRQKLSLPILMPHPLDRSAIWAASPEVVEAGVQIGMSLYQAQQIAPTALVIEPAQFCTTTWNWPPEARFRLEMARLDPVAPATFTPLDTH